MGGGGYQSYICVAWEWYGGMWWAHCPAGTWNSTQMSRHSTNETPHSENFRHVVNKNWIYWAKRFVYLYVDFVIWTFVTHYQKNCLSQLIKEKDLKLFFVFGSGTSLTESVKSPNWEIFKAGDVGAQNCSWCRIRTLFQWTLGAVGLQYVPYWFKNL